MKYVVVIIILLYSCNMQPTPEKQEVMSKISIQAKDSIICPDGNTQYDLDSIPPSLISFNKNADGVCGNWFPKDTITPQGNYVKYLISNDSSCLSNLYIEWGNAKFKNLKCLGDLRLFHPKVYPRLYGESEDYLFLGSAASSGWPISGWNLSLFPIKSGGSIKTYDLFDPDAFDPQSMTLLREIERPTETYFLEAYNIKTKRTKKIHFKNKLPLYFKDRLSPDDHNWCIDSISITSNIIFLKVSLPDSRNELISETIILANDIK